MVELLIVIGLIALVGGLVVINANAILSGLGDEPIDRTLRKAVREARYQAAALKQPVKLRFDAEAAAWVVIAPAGAELERFPTVYSNNANRLRVTIEQILPGRGLTAGQPRQTAEIPAVVFRPDRSSTPFQVRIQGEDPAFTLRFDPFSDIVLYDSRSR